MTREILVAMADSHSGRRPGLLDPATAPIDIDWEDNVEERQPGDMNMRDYAQAADASETAAPRRLDRLVAHGVPETPGLAFDPGQQQQARMWR